jgi:hypothetical protein
MRRSVWFLAPVIGIAAGLLSARGDTIETDDPWNPWWLRVVTQAPVNLPRSKAFLTPPSDPAGYPRSGVLRAPPPAPVAVPSSGFLEAPLERRTIKTTSVNLAPSPDGAATAITATEHLRRTVVRGAESRRREHLAGSVASARATTVRAMKKMRIFAVAGDRQAPVLHSRW